MVQSINLKLKLDASELRGLTGGGGAGGLGALVGGASLGRAAGIGAAAGAAAGGVIVALQGIKIGIEKLVEASPQLQGSLLLLRKSMELALRPIGDAIGLAIRPLALRMLKLISEGGIKGLFTAILGDIEEPQDQISKLIRNITGSLSTLFEDDIPDILGATGDAFGDLTDSMRESMLKLGNTAAAVLAAIDAAGKPGAGPFLPFPQEGDDIQTFPAGGRGAFFAGQGGRRTAGGGFIFEGKSHQEVIDTVNRWNQQ